MINDSINLIIPLSQFRLLEFILFYFFLFFMISSVLFSGQSRHREHIGQTTRKFFDKSDSVSDPLHSHRLAFGYNILLYLFELFFKIQKCIFFYYSGLNPARRIRSCKYEPAVLLGAIDWIRRDCYLIDLLLILLSLFSSLSALNAVFCCVWFIWRSVFLLEPPSPSKRSSAPICF